MSEDRLLQELRQSLHECPELAGHEVRTANIVASFLRRFKPTRILSNLGGSGLAAIYEGASTTTLMLRCELDALPVENGQVGFSRGRSCAHLCGHDGHMAIIAGVAPWLAKEVPPCRVVLLFQPAEETGEGAKRVIDDPRFPEVRPDYAVALHNLPGYAMGQVLLRHGTFACCSAGLSVQLHGSSSHAATPEDGNSPLACLCRLATVVGDLVEADGDNPGNLVTVTHMMLGEPSFGVTPGQGRLLATFRSDNSEELRRMKRESESLVQEEAAFHSLRADIQWHDEFPVTRSDYALVQTLSDCCQELEIKHNEPPVPFRWSEDFGHFSQVCPTLYFGLGAGEHTPGLHEPGYQFPDELMTTGVDLLRCFLKRISLPSG